MKTSIEQGEVVGNCTGTKEGAVFFRGSSPIDGIWVTNGVEIVNAYIVPIGFGVGDHRLFVADFKTRSLIGNSPPSIVRHVLRILDTRIEGCADTCKKSLKIAS